MNGAIKNSRSFSPLSCDEHHINSMALQMLLKSVYTVFLSEVSATEALITSYLSSSNPPFDPSAFPARKRFLARRIKLVQNILRWRKYTAERFGIGELTTRILIRCIAPVAERGWDVGGEESMRKAS